RGAAVVSGVGKDAFSLRIKQKVRAAEQLAEMASASAKRRLRAAKKKKKNCQTHINGSVKLMAPFFKQFYVAGKKKKKIKRNTMLSIISDLSNYCTFFCRKKKKK
ncbi:hypothetical protein F9876_17455, partial [Morganella morganii]|uniref:hypothetical protein n=1 Tax=Morganella morganii TaxID=582 RepID=UPI0015F51FBA